MEKARRKADLTIGKEKKAKSRWSRERGRVEKVRRKADLTIGKEKKVKSRWSREQIGRMRKRKSLE